MKAIKILKKIYKNNPDTRIQRNNVDVNFTIHDFNNINEAIKELEELQERILHLESIETDMIMEEIRSCIGCVNSIKSNSQDCISCSRQYQDNFKIIKNKA